MKKSIVFLSLAVICLSTISGCCTTRCDQDALSTYVASSQERAATTKELVYRCMCAERREGDDYDCEDYELSSEFCEEAIGNLQTIHDGTETVQEACDEEGDD